MKPDNIPYIGGGAQVERPTPTAIEQLQDIQDGQFWRDADRMVDGSDSQEYDNKEEV